MDENQALESLGVGFSSDPYSNATPAENLSSTITSFNEQNLSPGDIYRAVQSIPRTVGGVFPGIGATIPEVGRIPLPFPQIGGVAGQVLSIPDVLKLGSSGDWQSIRYGYDLNSHHPKFKFLFKVGFIGFVPDVRDFYYFVNRCDKPRVKIQHQDVNYYNFRTRVQTSVLFEPLTIQFLDEIGNSVNDFFSAYLAQRSGSGSGGWGIDDGFGTSSSSKPYTNGYAAGKEIVIEQIFANGTHSNRFHFINPRIESFDFDELAMDENAGSMMTVSFSYDALECETVGQSVINTWGETDLLRGGGTSGASNGGATSLGETGVFGAVSAALGIGSGSSSLTKQPDISYSNLQSGISLLGQAPGSISDLLNGGVQKISSATNKFLGSSGDRLSTNIQDTLQSITSGDNLQFGGAAVGEFNDRRFSGEVLTDSQPAPTLDQNFP